MEYDSTLYDVVLEQAELAIRAEFPIIDTSVVRRLADDTVRRLVEEDLIITPPKCEYGNPSRTVDCENFAPIGKSYCYKHN